MTPLGKRRLRECLGYFGLQLRYVRDLPDNVPGFLEQGTYPRFIFLNERKSSSDHAFTVAHELGHYVMHLDRPHESRMPPYLDYDWDWKLLREATQLTKGWAQPFYGPEGEADAWAFAFLLKLRATDDMRAILELYPKKSWIFFLVCAISTYKGLKRRLRNFFQELFEALTGSEEQTKF